MFDWAFVVPSCLSLSSFSLSTLLFHTLLVPCPALHLQCRHRRGLKPLHLRRMRSIAPLRCTILTKGYEPNFLGDFHCSETSALGWIWRHRHGAFVLVRCGSRRWDYRKSAVFSTVHSGARRTSELETKLITLKKKSLLLAQFFFAHTSTGSPVFELGSCQKKSNRDVANERIRIFFEKQKEQILAEVRVEINMH